MIKVDDFANAIMNELENYTAEAIRDTKKAVQETANECREEIMQKAPGSGKYKNSWKTKQGYLSATQSQVIVYSTKYQLTHLLEYGHEKWVWGHYTGDRVRAIPHIRPAEEHATQRLVERIKKAL